MISKVVWASLVVCLHAMQETQVQSLGWEDPWRKKWQLTLRPLAGKFHGWRSLAMASHSSTLAWKIPWMEEPGRPQSMGSLRVGHD